MMEKRIPVHMDGKKVYDIVMEQSFGQLEEELRGMNLQRGPALFGGSGANRVSLLQEDGTLHFPGRGGE